jgi:hypothetical protein
MSIFFKLFTPIIKWIGSIKWKQRHAITDDDKRIIHDALVSNYFIILTRRSNRLTTYLISLGHFLLTGKFGYWSHVLMNLEDEVNDPSDFRLIEAIGTGTQYSTFDQVFGSVDGVALLKPKGIAIQEWTDIMDRVRSQLGKPYDTLFDIKNDDKLSCVELVRIGLMAIPNYETRFANFEKYIAKSKNLTPQMFYDCSDFEVVYSVRR